MTAQSIAARKGRSTMKQPTTRRARAASHRSCSTRTIIGRILAELLRRREAARRQAAGLGPLPQPFLERGFRAGLVAEAPGEALRQIEGLHVGQAAILVFLQDDAAAARH